MPVGPSLIGPSIELVVESELWAGAPEAESTVRRAIAAAAAAAPEKADDEEVSVLLTDDARIQELNRTWRGFDKPTNVLSFPAADAPPGLKPRPLGDVVIAYQTLAREADTDHKLFLHHLSHLTVHGYLHLLGYDHESDAEAEAMEQLERAILARLDVPDPYLPSEV
jgi:probable rRNA maturation factor